MQPPLHLLCISTASLPAHLSHTPPSIKAPSQFKPSPSPHQAPTPTTAAAHHHNTPAADSTPCPSSHPLRLHPPHPYKPRITRPQRPLLLPRIRTHHLILHSRHSIYLILLRAPDAHAPTQEEDYDGRNAELGVDEGDDMPASWAWELLEEVCGGWEGCGGWWWWWSCLLGWSRWCL